MNDYGALKESLALIFTIAIVFTTLAIILFAFFTAIFPSDKIDKSKDCIAIVSQDPLVIMTCEDMIRSRR